MLSLGGNFDFGGANFGFRNYKPDYQQDIL